MNLFNKTVTISLVSTLCAASAAMASSGDSTRDDQASVSVIAKRTIEPISREERGLILGRQIEKLTSTMVYGDEAASFRGIGQQLIDSNYGLQACTDYLYVLSKAQAKDVVYLQEPPVLKRMFSKGKKEGLVETVSHIRALLDYMPKESMQEAAAILFTLAQKFTEHPGGPIAPKFFGRRIITADESFMILSKAKELVSTPNTDIKIESWKHFTQTMIALCEGEPIEELPRVYEPAKAHRNLLKVLSHTHKDLKGEFRLYIDQLTSRELSLLDEYLNKKVPVDSYPHSFFPIFARVMGMEQSWESKKSIIKAEVDAVMPSADDYEPGMGILYLRNVTEFGK